MFNRSINVFGLIPFFIIFLKYFSLMSFVILYNGIIYHGYHEPYIYIDILFNSTFILWVNIYSNYSLTLAITTFALIFFLLNYYFKSNLLHTLFVQWPFAFLLSYYYYTYSHEKIFKNI